MSQFTRCPHGGVNQGVERAGHGIQAHQIACTQLAQRAPGQGFRADVDGSRNFAGRPAHASIGKQRHLEATPLQHAQRRRELVQLGHAVGARTLKAHDRHEVTFQRALVEGCKQFLLGLENQRRRLGDVSVCGHSRHLDHGPAEVADEQLQAALRTERRRGGSHHRVVDRRRWQIMPDELAGVCIRRHFAIFAQTARHHSCHVSVHRAAVDQLADHEAGASRRLELVDVGHTVRVDAGQQRRGG